MKNFISKTKKSFKNGGMKKMFMTFALVLTMCVVTLNTAALAYADTNLSKLEDNLGLTKNDANGTSNMLGNIINIIAMLARVVGVLLGVYGLYKLIVAFKDQDANGITQGIVLLAVGIILIMFETIVEAVFGIKIS